MHSRATVMARRETRGSSSPTSPSKRLKTLAPPSITKETWKKDEGDKDDCCGICLSSDNGKTIRGEIDSCNHYFCFLCIMEWAKVETKCPLCKQRFCSIRRPPKDGVFSTDRIVTVPPRDQAHNSTTVDPYAETKCCVCHGMEDECFLLLCDLCDSAAHTFCVGLGHTVPSGDWFCHECNVMKETQLDMEESDDGEHSEIPVVDTHVSAQCNTSIDTDSRATSMTRRSPYLTARDIVSDHDWDTEETRTQTRDNANIVSASANLSARTRYQCRDVHNRIRTLRTHWDSFRQVSSNFAPTFSSSSDQDISVNPSSSSSKPEVVSLQRVSVDIERAWKMLDIAKHRQRASTSTSSVLHRAPPSNSMKGKAVALMRKCVTRRDGRLQIAMQANHDYAGSRDGTTTASSAIAGKRSEDKYIIKRKNQIQSREGIGAESSQGVRTLGHRAIASTNHCSFTEEECKSKEASSSSRVPDGAKGEILSIVKPNLKLLTRSKRLGVDVYKGIARDATHTLLAACNLEHKKAHVHELPSPVCLHTDRINQFNESTLMANTCKQCFHAFVEEVVHSIIQAKVAQ